MKTSLMHGSTARCAVALAGALAMGVAAAKAPEQAGGSEFRRYIVVLEEPSLAEWHRQQDARAASATRSVGGPSKAPPARASEKLDARSAEARNYLARLDTDFRTLKQDWEGALGRQFQPIHRYRHALNGFSARLTQAEAQRLAGRPGIAVVEPEVMHRLHTDAGPEWIGADEVWNGAGSLPGAQGEGIVIGVIDSGINWEHSSFEDPGEGGAPFGGAYDHVNPFGMELGLCSDPEVACNDKLVGVYDFVEDDPDTEVTEENTKGRDNTNHGSAVAAIAAGNRLNVTIQGGAPTPISGVAPNANIVSYRTCYLGDPDDNSDDLCQGSAILKAIDQAVADGVDVINYSIGSPAVSPWSSPEARAFLNAFDAGIFVATSGGNEGPAAATVNTPANAPWLMAVGSASHDRVLGSALQNLSGGDTPPPAGIIGDTLTDGFGISPIVHAGDFGNALCGAGEPELEADCEENTGASNPFPPGTFNGQIVVCDRGEYGRVEKGKNVQLAGAGAMILANTGESLQDTRADDHCLPAMHIDRQDGDDLRAWLASGSGHQGSLSGFQVLYLDERGDRVSSFSSRGPNLPPAQDLLKPDLIAPGENILAASSEANGFIFTSGTSFSSPHVAGAAALLRSVHPDWPPDMLASALQLTSTASQATDLDGSPATPHERGSGRPQLGAAANSGLYLRETRAAFEAANPNLGGNPQALNLAGLVDNGCQEQCSFTRTVTALAGGHTWTASAANFPAGVSVSIAPEQFTLAMGASQQLTIDIDVSSGLVTGQWVYGDIRLSATGRPDAVLTAAVFASGGDLPPEWVIETETDSGSEWFELSGLSAMPDATFAGGGLVRPTLTSRNLVQDPTRDDPYDSEAGTFTVLLDVPPGALWLYTETLPSTAVDLDLFVGVDRNGDGFAEESEMVCESTSPDELENCDIFNPEAGSWWVLVQNWSASAAPPDEATLASAVIGGEASPTLAATGPGIVAGGAPFMLRLSWQDVNALPGEEWLGAVGIGTRREFPANIGVIPVRIKRTGVAAAPTRPLFDGRAHHLAVAAGGSYDRAFIDIPEGTASLAVSASAADGAQNDDLAVDLIRVDFAQAFEGAHFVVRAPERNPDASATGMGGSGPQLTLTGAALQPGRWYVVVRNTGDAPSAVTLSAALTAGGNAFPMYGGLWQPSSRPDINQGYEYSASGSVRALLWYTYEQDGTSVWYIASGPAPTGNVWTAELLRFTNDGSRQQGTVVGRISITLLAVDDAVFSFTVNGASGSDRMEPITVNTCPQVNGGVLSVTGIWYPGFDGLGGASVVFNDFAHAQIHYVFDLFGLPRWLLGAEPEGNDLSLLQFSGFCAVCGEAPVTSEAVGTLTHGFQSSTSGQWTLDYLFMAPVSGNVQRTDSISKLTDTLACD